MAFLHAKEIVAKVQNCSMTSSSPGGSHCRTHECKAVCTVASLSETIRTKLVQPVFETCLISSRLCLENKNYKSSISVHSLSPPPPPKKSPLTLPSDFSSLWKANITWQYLFWTKCENMGMSAKCLFWIFSFQRVHPISSIYTSVKIDAISPIAFLGNGSNSWTGLCYTFCLSEFPLFMLQAPQDWILGASWVVC